MEPKCLCHLVRIWYNGDFMCLYARDVKSKEFWNLPNTWISTYFQSERPSALFGAIVLLYIYYTVTSVSVCLAWGLICQCWLHHQAIEGVTNLDLKRSFSFSLRLNILELLNPFIISHPALKLRYFSQLCMLCVLSVALAIAVLNLFNYY